MVTTFYVLGGALTVLALIISFIGMRSEKFPSDNALKVGIALFAVVVAVTAVYAVKASQHEAEEREHEENALASGEAEDEEIGNEQIGENDVEDGAPDVTAPADDVMTGLQVFNDQGCAGCHSLEAADATGQIGPNLDAELVDRDKAYIEESIVDPNADIVEGFGEGIMPDDYGEFIDGENLTNLVNFLYDSTHEAAK